MLRDLLSNRWIQAGLIFFLLILGSSQLYYWHVRRIGAVDLKKMGRFLGDPDDTKHVRSIAKKKHKARESFTEADVPWLLLVPFEDAGIDPYTFLELP